MKLRWNESKVVASWGRAFRILTDAEYSSYPLEFNSNSLKLWAYLLLRRPFHKFSSFSLHFSLLQKLNTTTNIVVVKASSKQAALVSEQLSSPPPPAVQLKHTNWGVKFWVVGYSVTPSSSNDNNKAYSNLLLESFKQVGIEREKNDKFAP